MEDFASLTAEARSHDDNREETSPTQKYPPAYPPSSATAIPQTAAGGSVTASVLTYQPQPYTWGSGISEEGRGNLGGNPSHAAADRMFAISVCICIVCCLCGSPLTLACFIPAILLSAKVNDLAEDGDRTKALNTARVLIIVGAVAGVVITVIAIIWNVYRIRSLQSEEDQNDYN